MSTTDAERKAQEAYEKEVEEIQEKASVNYLSPSGVHGTVAADLDGFIVVGKGAIEKLFKKNVGENLIRKYVDEYIKVFSQEYEKNVYLRSRYKNIGEWEARIKQERKVMDDLVNIFSTPAVKATSTSSAAASAGAAADSPAKPAAVKVASATVTTGPGSVAADDVAAAGDPTLTAGSSLGAQLGAATDDFKRLSEQVTPVTKDQQSKIMSAAYSKAIATSKNLVATATDITPQKINESFERIQKNIANAKNSTTIDENSIYKGVNIGSSTKDNLSVKIHHAEGKKSDEITRTVGSDNKMTATLSRNSEDASFLLFCDMNKEFSPISMQPTGDDLGIKLKVLEAGVMRGVKIELSQEDKQKFTALDDNNPSKIHYNLLQDKPNDFLDQVSTIGDRKLGTPLPTKPTEVLSFSSQKPSGN